MLIPLQDPESGTGTVRTMKDHFDVVVVGAGPAGTTAARCCAEAGLPVLCIEEHGTIGYPVQCAGLLSTAAFRECGVSGTSVLNRVTGACVYGERGAEVSFDAGETKALVVDRGSLDREMAGAAADAGAEFRVKTGVYRLGPSSVLTRGPDGRRETGYRVLIAADGSRSTIARMQGMARAPVYLAGLQADLACDMDERLVQIYPDASPAFFGWAIPLGRGRARVGLAGTTGIRSRFGAFVRPFGGRWTQFSCGTIPLGTMPVTYGNRTLYVGDAAGLAKPTSGGGVYTGVRSARHAAETAITACEAGRYDDGILKGYEAAWKADFGRELSLGFRLFRMRQELGPAEMDELLRALSRPEVVEAIVRYGDMDRPGALVRHLVAKPAMLLLLGKLLGPGIRSLVSGK